MKLINKTPNPSGSYGNIQNCSLSRVPENMVLWPDELDTKLFFEYKGFIKPELGEVDVVVGQKTVFVETAVEEEGSEPVLTPVLQDVVEKWPCVMSYEGNQEAFDAWEAEHPTVVVDPVDEARSAKEKEMSDACNAAIVAGMDVETSVGTEHFSLQETDQINLNAALTAVQNGATGYPYHADGTLCRLFSAEEILAIAEAGTNHKLYHTTLCNHLLTWARRAETVEEIESITYSAENLPEDLAANMASIFAATASI